MQFQKYTVIVLDSGEEMSTYFSSQHRGHEGMLLSLCCLKRPGKNFSSNMLPLARIEIVDALYFAEGIRNGRRDLAKQASCGYWGRMHEGGILVEVMVEAETPCCTGMKRI